MSTFLDKPSGTRGVPALRILRACAIGAAVAVSAGALTACMAPSSEAVHQSRPTVSYAYTTDRELVDISRRAEAYCRTYGGWPRTTNAVNRGDGQRTITYECDPTTYPPAAASAAQVPPRPGVTYTYRTDQDLVDATRNADAQCRQVDARARTANIVTNADGSKTVSFSCERPL